MIEEKNTTAAQTISTETAETQVAEDNAPRLVKKFGKTTYLVSIHFSETSKETMDDKIYRLMKNDIRKAYNR